MHRLRIATRRISSIAGLWLLAAALGACDDSPAGPTPGAIDLDALFAPPTAAEIAAVEADWATRDVRVEGVQPELQSVVLLGGGLGTARVFSHLVEGARHYGAVLVPSGAAPGSLPVIVFAHGGDTGVDVGEVALLLALLGEQTRNFAFVVPSFRSEPLTLDGQTFTSGGEPSPWDRDVDDALAFLEVALQEVPETNSERIAALGYSRGGTVALLMAARDDRIQRVVEFAAPTDFFGSWIRTIVEDALDGQPSGLPAIDVLEEHLVGPLRDGSMDAATFRSELIRRSPSLWAERLPPIQLHHGTADAVVPVSQAVSLMDALEAHSREGDEFYLYEGAGHSPLEMRESDARAIGFLARVRN